VSGERRILHLSDIHFGPKHLAEVSDAVAASVEVEKPDLVIVSGDLTQRAKPRQFREARAFVERLEKTAPVVAVPGNHDVPLWRVWERLFTPYGAWRKHFRDELEPIYRDPALLVVGVNTAQAFAFKGGRLRARRVRELEAALAGAPNGAFRIVVAHHHLIRPRGVEAAEHACWGAAAGMPCLVRSGVDLVLSGHLHQTLELFPAGPDAFPALHTGTSSSSRGRGPESGHCTHQWIEVAEEAFSVTGRSWDAVAKRFRTTFSRRYPRRSASRSGSGTGG
jgi:3',5'-cyclic AMP phosphodiesterase CpdA